MIWDTSKNPHVHEGEPQGFERVHAARNMTPEQRSREVRGGIRAAGRYVNRVRTLIRGGRC